MDLTPLTSRPSIYAMDKKSKTGVPGQVLAKLESRLKDLISSCDQLKQENSQLRDENTTLLTDRGQLMANRDKVRTQVEAMIGRLKSMESS